MRGKVDGQGEIYHSFQLEDMVPAHHPLRAVKSRADKVLGKMSRRFHQPYGKTGRPSVPPERLIKALLLQAIYSIRSEIQLYEQIGYNMLYRWFLDRSPSEKACTPEVFSVNRQRFDEHGVVSDFLDYVVREAILENLVSQDHFSVDGTLIQSFASMKSLRPINTEDNKVSDRSDDDDPGNPTVNFRGERRSNKTHRRMETQATKRSDRRGLQPLENGPTGADGLIRNGIAEPRRRIAKAESNENTHPNQHHRSPGMKNSTANPLSPPLFSSLLDLRINAANPGKASRGFGVRRPSTLRGAASRQHSTNVDWQYQEARWILHRSSRYRSKICRSHAPIQVS